MTHIQKLNFFSFSIFFFWLAFGTQKQEIFNGKIASIFYKNCVIKDIKRDLHELF